jgi:hypothetical protein
MRVRCKVAFQGTWGNVPGFEFLGSTVRNIFPDSTKHETRNSVFQSSVSVAFRFAQMDGYTNSAGLIRMPNLRSWYRIVP